MKISKIGYNVSSGPEMFVFSSIFVPFMSGFSLNRESISPIIFFPRVIFAGCFRLKTQEEELLLLECLMCSFIEIQLSRTLHQRQRSERMK